MSLFYDEKDDTKPTGEVKQKKDAEREETNKTDPQLTELKGYVDSDEPLEEKGTPNPLLGTHE